MVACALVLAIPAHKAKDVSVKEAGPFSPVDESMERTLSEIAEDSSKLLSNKTYMRWQAALHVSCELEAREASSQICCQCKLKTAALASGPLAMLINFDISQNRGV